MADRFTPARGDSPTRDGGRAPAGGDPWGPSTAVGRGASNADSYRRPNVPTQPAKQATAQRPTQRPAQTQTQTQRPARDTDWTPAGPASRDQQRADKQMERQLREMRTAVRPHERGVRWWLALLVLAAIAVIGGLIDTIGTSAARGGFNIGIVVASVVGILIVKRSHMFPIVIAPPIVYSLAAVFQLYLRSSGLHDKKVVLDAAANYLVYGFPAIAAATAAVLIIAGIRLILRK